ncbi:MAG: ABC transporter ATP-binding protein [Bacteriovoracaceae bacterium]|nr:ABC transporter ATP-binding protein [Bacteriovoracaceae bacterium]
MNFFKNNWFNVFFNPKGRLYLGLILLSLMGAGYLGFQMPKLISLFFKSYNHDAEFLRIGSFLVILFLLEYINTFLYSYGTLRYVSVVIQEMRSFSYERWLLSYPTGSRTRDQKGTADEFPLGEVLARIMSDTESARELVTSGSLRIIIDFVFIIASLVSFLGMHLKVGIFMLLLKVMTLILLFMASKFMARIYSSVRKKKAVMSRSLANVIPGFNQLYYTPHHQMSSGKSSALFLAFVKENFKWVSCDAAFFSIAESLLPIFLLFFVLCFPLMGVVEIALVAAMVDLLQRSLGPVKEFSSKIAQIQRSLTGFKRVSEFVHHLNQGSFSQGEKSSQHIDIQKMKIDIKIFDYPMSAGGDKSFGLRDITFEVQQKEMIGLVGLSGSGKSTLLKILSGEIFCQEGAITLHTSQNNIITVAQNLALYREQVSLVSQDSHLFSESLRFNMLMGREISDVDERFIQMQNEIPYLKTWGIALDDKINPKKLSSGQKQLISALRACFLKKPILLFDEISSALDSELEEALRKLVLWVQKDSITFVVAHRLETIISADNILVLGGGRLVASGTHQELLKQSELYQKFIKEITAV